MVDDPRVRTRPAEVAVVAALLALPWPAHAAPLRIRAGHKRVLELRVPKARRHRIRLGHTRWLRAQLWLGGPRPRRYDVRCRRSPRR
jgi:hypothetical protein